MSVQTIGTKSNADRLKKYAQYECTTDLSHLNPHEKVALQHLVKAAKVVDDIWYRQQWSGTEALRQKILNGDDEELKEVFETYKVKNDFIKDMNIIWTCLFFFFILLK